MCPSPLIYPRRECGGNLETENASVIPETVEKGCSDVILSHGIVRYMLYNAR